MRRSQKHALATILLTLPLAFASAQELDQIPPPPLRDPEAIEVPLGTAHLTNHGRPIPAGWNVAATADALGVYDSNPLSVSDPQGEFEQRYSADVSVTDRAKHTSYQAVYEPSYSLHKRYDQLNMLEQNFSQVLWHDFSPQTAMSWRVNAQRYPSWGGSAFAGSAFGALLMQLTGISGLDLRQEVTRGTMGLSLERVEGFRSHWRIDLEGGASRYQPTSESQIVALLTAPGSSTWFGEVNLLYEHHITRSRVLGVSLSDAYFTFTLPAYHSQEQIAQLRYMQYFRNGWGLMAGAGPEFRENPMVKGTLQPAMSFTADVGRTSMRSVVRVTFTDGYQLGRAQGNLSNSVLAASAERALLRRTYVGAFANYERSNASVPTGQLAAGNTTLVAFAGSGGVRLSREITWFVNYGVGLQKGVLTGEKQIHRQQFVSGLSWNTNNLFRTEGGAR